MLHVVGLTITGLSGLAIGIIGLLYLFRPRRIAAAFGLPALPDEAATPWLRVKGVRDLAAGLVAAVLLLTAPSTTIGWALLAFTIIPIGDAASVLSARGKTVTAVSVHGSTALFMLVGAILLILDP